MFVGSVLFVIPGIIAYVAFSFMIVYVAVEDKNFIAGFRDSWQLTRGHWLRLFGLLLVIVAGIGLISGVLTAMTSLVVGAIAGQGIGILLSGVVGLPFSLLILAILAEAFTQLREGQKTMVKS
jgi:TRAP-type C4-dicarboxylate transport system permease large subunit